MTPRTELGSMVVMADEPEGQHPWMGSALLERLQYILDEKNWNAADWSRAAGIANRTHLSNLMRRLAKNEKATAELPVFAQLAIGAGCSLDFLILGRLPAFGGAIAVDADAEYPSRAHAIGAARLIGMSERAIAATLAVSGLPGDPGNRYWIERIGLEEKALLALASAPRGAPEARAARRKKRSITSHHT